MLSHPHGHHRQFLDLTARRRTDRDPVGHTEPMPAGAVSRPVIDDLVDRPTPATAWRPCPHALAVRPACAPTGHRRALAARRADRRWAAATSSETSAWSCARAARSAPPDARPASPAARPARSAAHSASTAPTRPRQRHRDPGHRSPPPRPAPQHEIRQRPVMSPNPTERLQPRCPMQVINLWTGGARPGTAVRGDRCSSSTASVLRRALAGGSFRARRRLPPDRLRRRPATSS